MGTRINPNLFYHLTCLTCTWLLKLLHVEFDMWWLLQPAKSLTGRVLHQYKSVKSQKELIKRCLEIWSFTLVFSRLYFLKIPLPKAHFSFYWRGCSCWEWCVFDASCLWNLSCWGSSVPVLADAFQKLGTSKMDRNIYVEWLTFMLSKSIWILPHEAALTFNFKQP